MSVGGGDSFGGVGVPDSVHEYGEHMELAGKIYGVLDQGRGKNGIRVALGKRGEDYSLEQISTVLDLMVEGGTLEVIRDGFREMYRRAGDRPTH